MSFTCCTNHNKLDPGGAVVDVLRSGKVEKLTRARNSWTKDAMEPQNAELILLIHLLKLFHFAVCFAHIVGATIAVGAEAGCNRSAWVEHHHCRTP